MASVSPFGLFDKGILTGEHLAILAPAIYLMGSQVQYLGRILGVIGTRAKRIPLMIAPFGGQRFLSHAADAHYSLNRT
ncbi:Uncharacterised protein [Leclercia adecarboxylata]|uniref:Uncharacterized protein n=1 Tax=Leclercia adecarboxylata TaxID=83655 RepID=A0A4U9HRD2_9ENTR|nr:Uncharacterised protein [Leclercia adecarboxylata]